MEQEGKLKSNKESINRLDKKCKRLDKENKDLKAKKKEADAEGLQ